MCVFSKLIKMTKTLIEHPLASIRFQQDKIHLNNCCVGLLPYFTSNTQEQRTIQIIDFTMQSLQPSASESVSKMIVVEVPEEKKNQT